MSDHAVFLVHGLWGNKAHFWCIEQQLRQTYPSLKIHACAVNEGNKTYDGIDVGGDRVVSEVQFPLKPVVDDRLRRSWQNGVKPTRPLRNFLLLDILLVSILFGER
jgi:hypothetical protein